MSRNKDYTLYSNSEQRSTSYCTMRFEGGLELNTSDKNKKWYPVLQLIRRHKDNAERIRFGYHDDSKSFIARPLEIREERIPALFDGACQAGILRKDTVRELVKVLEKYAE